MVKSHICIASFTASIVADGKSTSSTSAMVQGESFVLLT